MTDLQRMEALIRTAKDDLNELPQFSSCLQRIAGLQDLVDRVAELDKPKTGWFSSSSTGLAESQLAQHFATIVWFLGHKYSEISKSFDRQKANRKQDLSHLKHVQEKRAMALAASTLQQKSMTRPILPVEEKIAVDAFAQKYDLSPDQVQMLQHEKQELFHELADTQSQMRQTERSVAEIARLQTTLQESLMYQETQIERLYDDVDTALLMVDRGNAYLGKAAKNQSAFSKIIVTLVLCLTGILLFMHFYLD